MFEDGFSSKKYSIEISHFDDFFGIFSFDFLCMVVDVFQSGSKKGNRIRIN